MPASPPQFQVALGKAIRTRRKAIPLTQLEVATETGLSQYWISEVENGKRSINISSLRRLATALDIEDWELLRDSRRFAADDAIQ